MKSLSFAAILLAAFVPSAFANTYGQTLPETDLAAIHYFAPGADLTALTPSQVSALATALNSGNKNAEVHQQVRAILD